VRLVLKYVAYLEKRGYARKTTGNGETNKKYAQKTFLNEVTTIKQAVRWFIEEGFLVDREPLKLKMKKVESQPAYCWLPAEVSMMVEHCSKDPSLKWLYDVIGALACTGLRIAELASLRWTDFDFERGMLVLTDETGYKETSFSKRRLKSGRSRSFPIHPTYAEALRKMPRTGRYVYQGPRGGRLKPDTFGRSLKRDIIKPLSATIDSKDGVRGFSDGTAHSFRHYFCSTCANNGVPDRIVMQWLGHSN